MLSKIRYATYDCFRVLTSFKDANRVISSDAIVIDCDMRGPFHDVPHGGMGLREAFAAGSAVSEYVKD